MKCRNLVIACLGLGFSAGALADSYTAVAADPAITIPDGGVAPPDVLGSLVVFPDRASFLSAAPGVVTEDFETNQVADNNVATCAEPVSSAGAAPCFNAGDLLDGFSITSSSGGGVVILTTGFFGAPSDIVGANTFGDTTTVDFNPPVTAVGMDVFAGLNPSDVMLTFRDSGGGTIGTVSVTGLGAIPDNGFAGVTSASPIASVELDSLGGNGELIDNMAFGSAGPPPIIPTLSMAGLAALALLMVGVAVVVLRRRANG